MEQTDAQDEIEGDDRFTRAKNADVPEIYTNGFITGLGSGDVFVVLERNGSPVAILNMSYTVAKTIAAALGNTIAQLEEKTGREMLTTTDLERVFNVEESDASASDAKSEVERK